MVGGKPVRTSGVFASGRTSVTAVYRGFPRFTAGQVDVVVASKLTAVV